MSDISSAPAERNTPAAPPPAKETNPQRLILLLLVFGVALAGLLYDYTIARPALQQADQTMQGLLEGTIKDPNNDGGVTESEVQELLGRAPSSVTLLDSGKMETYSWRSGLPFRTYSLYVVYSGKRLPLLYSASTNEVPTGSQLPATAAPLKQLTEEDIRNFVPPQPTGVGAPGAAADRAQKDRPAETSGGEPQ